MKNIVFLLATLSLFPVVGCASMAEGMVRSALGLKKDDVYDFARQREEQRKLEIERTWIQHWRNQPDENPAMTEAFKDDYR